MGYHTKSIINKKQRDNFFCTVLYKKKEKKKQSQTCNFEPVASVMSNKYASIQGETKQNKTVASAQIWKLSQTPNVQTALKCIS